MREAVVTIRRIFVQLLTLFGLYATLRVLFFFVNRPLFLKASPGEVIWSFVEGIRFDLAAIAMLNVAIITLHLIPLGRISRTLERGKAFVLGLGFTLVNGFALSLNVVDLEYFKFTGKRTTADGFLLARDIGDQTAQIALYYWYFSLLILAIYAVLAWVAYRTYRQSDKTNPAWILFFILFGALAIRGGWQSKPLIPATAFASSPELGPVVLNTTFTILKSSDKSPVSELKDLSPDEVKTIINNAVKREPVEGELSELWPKPKNVVFVILESFGTEYVFPPKGESYAPFLKTLAEKGSNFSFAYANARRSIDALPALFAGIPTWMEPPFITSPYQTNKISATPEIFSEQGYDTLFFHGGNNGTMFFDVMARRLGFQEYFGADQYPDRKDYDGKWGIFDEPYLQYMAKELSLRQKPFFAAVFTLSSHHPYTIPKEHQGRFPKGTLEIHESIGYADLALRKFYETAEKEPWFKDTLFVITADHTSKQEYPEFDNIPGRFRVPLVLIYNNERLPFPVEVLNQPVQHADLAPTLLDLSRMKPGETSHFGESLCRLVSRPGIVEYESDGYHLIGAKRGLSWWRDGRSQEFTIPFKAEGTEVDYADEHLIQYLKASAHYYNNGMVRNQLIW